MQDYKSKYEQYATAMKARGLDVEPMKPPVAPPPPEPPKVVMGSFDPIETLIFVLQAPNVTPVPYSQPYYDGSGGQYPGYQQQPYPPDYNSYGGPGQHYPDYNYGYDAYKQ